MPSSSISESGRCPIGVRWIGSPRSSLAPNPPRRSSSRRRVASWSGRVAGVRVALRRSAWLAAGRDLVGQRVHAVVERHRWALAGGSAELDLWFGEGRRIDPWLATAAEPRPVESVEERPALRVVSA